MEEKRLRAALLFPLIPQEGVKTSSRDPRTRSAHPETSASTKVPGSRRWRVAARDSRRLCPLESVCGQLAGWDAGFVFARPRGGCLLGVDASLLRRTLLGPLAVCRRVSPCVFPALLCVICVVRAHMLTDRQLRCVCCRQQSVFPLPGWRIGQRQSPHTCVFSLLTLSLTHSLRNVSPADLNLWSVIFAMVPCKASGGW